MKIVPQFLKYSTVAGGSAVCDWLIFLSLIFFGTPVIVTQSISRIGGGLFSFIANKFWSFDGQNQPHVTVQGRRFIGLFAVSYFLSIFLLYFLNEILGVQLYLAKVLTDSSVLVFNFILMRAYVYRDRSGAIAWVRQRLERN